MEDDLQVLKVEYLSNRWSELPQIWNLNSGDQTKIAWNEDDLQWKTTFNGKRPQNIKVEYLINHRSDLPQLLKIKNQKSLK